ncbi:MAG TPA: cell envelope integrity protein TolA, partial [Thiothrix sp.]|nr:cell envelope integrity protein TolA [Thiothrix sp.]
AAEKARRRAEAKAQEKAAEKARRRAEAKAQEKAAEKARRRAEAKEQRQAEERAKKRAAEKRQARENAKRAEAARARAAEKQRTAAARSRALGDWGAKIRRHVKPRWHAPPASNGMSARVKLKVSRSGYIRRLTVTSCQGSPAFCASVKDAFKRAEPLPSPARNDLFSENLNLTFRK